MEEFEFTLTIKVRIEAFDEKDAKDAVQDVFGPGSDGDVEVLSLDIK